MRQENVLCMHEMCTIKCIATVVSVVLCKPNSAIIVGVYPSIEHAGVLVLLDQALYRGDVLLSSLISSLFSLIDAHHNNVGEDQGHISASTRKLKENVKAILENYGEMLKAAKVSLFLLHKRLQSLHL